MQFWELFLWIIVDRKEKVKEPSTQSFFLLTGLQTLFSKIWQLRDFWPCLSLPRPAPWKKASPPIPDSYAGSQWSWFSSWFTSQTHWQMKWSKPRRGLYYATGSPGSNSEVHLGYIMVIIIMKDRILHCHILDYFSATSLTWMSQKMVNSLLSNYAKFCTIFCQCNGSKQFASQTPSSIKINVCSTYSMIFMTMV